MWPQWREGTFIQYKSPTCEHTHPQQDLVLGFCAGTCETHLLAWVSYSRWKYLAALGSFRRVADSTAQHCGWDIQEVLAGWHPMCWPSGAGTSGWPVHSLPHTWAPTGGDRSHARLTGNAPSLPGGLSYSVITQVTVGSWFPKTQKLCADLWHVVWLGDKHLSKNWHVRGTSQLHPISRISRRCWLCYWDQSIKAFYCSGCRGTEFVYLSAMRSVELWPASPNTGT